MPAIHHLARSLLLVAGLAAAPASAQSPGQATVVVPNGMANVEGDSFNNFPWGRGGSGLLMQSVYDPVNFTAQGIDHPIAITRLRWRPDDGRSSIASQYPVGATVRMATCPRASTAVTTTFADQRGPDDTIVFSGPVSWPAFAASNGPCPFLIDVPLSTPFVYDPAAGGLNIEVDLPAQGFSGTTPLQLDVMTFGSNASRVWLSSGYVNGGPNATTTFAPWIPHGVVVELTYALPAAFAAAVPYGAGCYDAARSVYEEFDGLTPIDLAGSGMTMFFDGMASYVCGPTIATWIPPSAAATSLPLADDTETNVTLQSPLPLPGGSTSRLTVCSNGFVSAGPGNGTGFDPTPAGFLGLPQTCWAADWHDYNPMAVGSGAVKFEQVGPLSIVTWDGVLGFANANPNTFQIQFDRSNGTVHVLWASMLDPFDHFVGCKVGGPAMDPGPRDLSASLPGFFVCGRDQRALHLAASARPVLGTTLRLDTTEAGAGTLGASVLGLATFAPGIELSALGMPGCLQHVGTDLFTFHLPSGGAFARLLAVPADPQLAGLHVANQSLILGDVSANPAGTRSSNALDLRLGSQ